MLRGRRRRVAQEVVHVLLVAWLLQNDEASSPPQKLLSGNDASAGMSTWRMPSWLGSPIRGRTPFSGAAVGQSLCTIGPTRAHDIRDDEDGHVLQRRVQKYEHMGEHGRGAQCRHKNKETYVRLNRERGGMDVQKTSSWLGCRGFSSTNVSRV